MIGKGEAIRRLGKRAFCVSHVKTLNEADRHREEGDGRSMNSISIVPHELCELCEML